MNERINQLKLECTTPRVWDVTTEKWVDEKIDVDKLAKLIVNESAKAIVTEIDSWSQLAPFNTIIKQRGIAALKKHFGL